MDWRNFSRPRLLHKSFNAPGALRFNIEVKMCPRPVVTVRILSRVDPRPAWAYPLGDPVGRATAAFYVEESPGSMERRWRLTAAEGDLRESATENKPPGFFPVRVKRCGKSAPRRWQQRWQGKPHREQDRIGMARAARRRVLRPRVSTRDHPGWLLEAGCEPGPR